MEAPSLTNPSFDDAPIVALLRKSPTQMTDEELTQHVNTLRALRTAPQTQKAAIKGTKAPAVVKQKIDVSQWIK